MKKIFFFLIIVFLFILTPQKMAFAGLSDSFSSTSLLTATAKASGYNPQANSALALTSTVIAIALSLMGTLFIILIIYGGVTWMLAEGNEQRVEKAGNIIRQAIIGLIIVIGAYGISFALLQIFGGQLK